MSKRRSPPGKSARKQAVIQVPPPPPCPKCGSFAVIPVNTSLKFMSAWFSCAKCYHLWRVVKEVSEG